MDDRASETVKQFSIAMALLASSTAAQSATLINGSFEEPLVAGPCCTTTPGDPLPGWTVDNGDVNVVTGTFGSTAGNLAFDGKQYLDLIGQTSTGGLSQTFATEAGKRYLLSFAFSHNLFGGSSTASGNYSVGSIAGSVTHVGGSTSDLKWNTFRKAFVAGEGPTSKLSFSGVQSGDNAGLLIDAVSISAVPEPSTWAMLIIGFGVAGAALRRRRASASFA